MLVIKKAYARERTLRRWGEGAARSRFCPYKISFIRAFFPHLAQKMRAER